MTIFHLALESDDGTVAEVPVDFDPLTPRQEALALTLWDRVTPADLAAARLFASTGLPVDEWDLIRPVLRDVIDGDYTHLEIREVTT